MQLRARALDKSNCMHMHTCALQGNEETTQDLDKGTFTDSAYWAFAELLRDMGWLTVNKCERVQATHDPDEVLDEVSIR